MKKILLIAAVLFLSVSMYAQAENDYLEIARDVLKTEKKAAIAEIMQLTQQENTPFWELYNEYQGKLYLVQNKSNPTPGQIGYKKHLTIMAKGLKIFSNTCIRIIQGSGIAAQNHENEQKVEITPNQVINHLNKFIFINYNNLNQVL